MYLYYSFLILQIYALVIHFYHPSSGSSAPLREKAVIFFSFTCGLLTFVPKTTPAPRFTALSTVSTIIFLLSHILFIWTAITSRPRRLAVIYANVTPRYVTQSGPFAWLRHPTYASYALGWLGSMLWTISKKNVGIYEIMAALGCLGTLMCLYGDAADLEEGQFLMLNTPDDVRREYESYKQRTSKWVPGVY